MDIYCFLAFVLGVGVLAWLVRLLLNTLPLYSTIPPFWELYNKLSEANTLLQKVILLFAIGWKIFGKSMVIAALSIISGTIVTMASAVCERDFVSDILRMMREFPRFIRCTLRAILLMPQCPEEVLDN